MDDRTTIQVPETTAQTPMGLGVLPERHRFAISPLNRRRWQNFKSNRRGYVSLWVFAILFVLSLFAEFIANDKPFYIRYDGRSFFPPEVSEETKKKLEENLAGATADFIKNPDSADAIIWLGRVLIACEAPGTRTSAVSTLRSLSAW